MGSGSRAVGAGHLGGQRRGGLSRHRRAAHAHVRTLDAGDPVLAWDNHGRLFAGSESSDDPAGTNKGFGDVWVATFRNPKGVNGPTSQDGKQFVQSLNVATGSSAPIGAGTFHDKPA